MKAVLLAAGKGTRMGDITQVTPKPMVEVRGKPILTHILEGLRDHAGVREAFIVTGHLAEVIENTLGDGKSLGVHLTYGRQIEQNGTGKAPEIAKDWLGNHDFILSYGDILVDGAEYGRMVQSKTHDAVIAVKPNQDLSTGGAVLVDDAGWMLDVIEKSKEPVKTSFLNAGIYVFSSSLFRFTAVLQKSPRGEYELTDALRGMLHHGLKIKVMELNGDWADVRDQQILKSLNQG